jgi:hypothetical protein
MTNRRINFLVAASISFLLVAASTTGAGAVAPQTKILKASNLVQIKFPQNFKLPKSGCAKIPFQYQINKLELDESSFTIVISDDQDRHIGEASWYGSSADAATKAMPKSGTLQIKVCRSAWYDSVEEVQSYPTYKGIYDIYLSATGSESADASASMRFSE